MQEWVAGMVLKPSWKEIFDQFEHLGRERGECFDFSFVKNEYALTEIIFYVTAALYYKCTELHYRAMSRI